MSELDPPRYPDRRPVYVAGKREDCVATLCRWASGMPFHRYGRLGYEDFLGMSSDEMSRVDLTEPWRKWYEAREAHPAVLDFKGSLRHHNGSMWWSVTFRRPGTIDLGACSGYGTAGDAAYAALNLIEEQERDLYLERLVIGIA